MKKTPKNIPSPYKFPGTPIFRDTTALPFADGGPLHDRDINSKLLQSTYASALGNMFREGGPFGEDRGVFDYATSIYASQPGNYYAQGGMIKTSYDNGGLLNKITYLPTQNLPEITVTPKKENNLIGYQGAPSPISIKDIKVPPGSIKPKKEDLLVKELNTLRKKLKYYDSQNDGHGPTNISDMFDRGDIYQKIVTLEGENQDILKNTPQLDKVQSTGNIGLTIGKYLTPPFIHKGINYLLNTVDTYDYAKDPNNEGNKANIAADALSVLKSPRTRIAPFSIMGDVLNLQQQYGIIKNAENSGEYSLKNNYRTGGQFPRPYSLPEDSFKQGGTNLHNSVYASSSAPYPGIYADGGPLLPPDNAPAGTPFNLANRNSWMGNYGMIPQGHNLSLPLTSLPGIGNQITSGAATANFKTVGDYVSAAENWERNQAGSPIAPGPVNINAVIPSTPPIPEVAKTNYYTDPYTGQVVKDFNPATGVATPREIPNSFGNTQYSSYLEKVANSPVAKENQQAINSERLSNMELLKTMTPEQKTAMRAAGLTPAQYLADPFSAGATKFAEGGMLGGPGDPVKPKPIYVTNPNDPRLLAHNDSLSRAQLSHHIMNYADALIAAKTQDQKKKVAQNYIQTRDKNRYSEKAEGAFKRHPDWKGKDISSKYKKSWYDFTTAKDDLRLDDAHAVPYKGSLFVGLDDYPNELFPFPKQKVILKKSKVEPTNVDWSKSSYEKKYPPIYLSDPNDPRIDGYAEAGNQYLYKPVAPKTNPKLEILNLPTKKLPQIETEIIPNNYNYIPQKYEPIQVANRSQTIMEADPDRENKYRIKEMRQVPYYANFPGEGWQPANAPKVLYIDSKGNEVEERPKELKQLDLKGETFENGGSILSMSNTPQLEGEGKDLTYPDGAYVYGRGGVIKTSQLFAGGGPIYPTNQQLAQFLNPEYQRVTQGQEVTVRPNAYQLQQAKNKAAGINKYDAINIKPQVAESTKPNIAPVDKNITEKAIAQKAGAWENFIKSGRAYGYYANPSTVYGTMKAKGGFIQNSPQTTVSKYPNNSYIYRLGGYYK